MNIVVESFLKKHIAEFELDLPADKAFEHFVNYIVFRNYTSRHFNPEILGTESGEIGLDGVGIIVNDTIVTDIEEVKGIFNSNIKDVNVDFVFVQAKSSEHIDVADINLFLTTAKEFFSDITKIRMNDKMDRMREIRKYIFDNAYKLNPNPKCYLYFASNGIWNGNASLQDVVNVTINDMERMHMFSEVTFVPLDQKRILEFARLTKNSIEKQISMNQSATIPSIANVEEAYVGIITCKDFIKLISDSDGRLMVNLFEDNVRYFQGNNTVNVEILQTLSSDGIQMEFPLLNNGVTVVAREIRRTGNSFTLKDFQIVNGCQTSFILYNNKELIKDDTSMVMKLVATKDTEITGRIVKATNRQTPIQTEAFETLRTFHHNLEEAYEGYDSDYRLYYERRSKQYDSTDINRNKIVSFPVQIYSYVAMFLEEPQSTHRYYGEVLNSNIKKMFRETDILNQYCISAIYLYYIERWINKNHQEKYKPFKYHIILLLRHLICGKSLPKPNSKDMRKMCDQLYDNLKCEGNMHEIIGKALQIVDTTCSVMPKEVDSYNYPRNRDFTKKMLSQIGYDYVDRNETTLKKGDIVTCKVVGNNYCFVFVELVEFRESGEIYIGELANHYVEDIRNVVKIGDVFDAMILDNTKHPDYGYRLSKRAAS